MTQIDPTAAQGGRDLRLDLFRGIALIWIFVNHLGDTVFSWMTIRNYGLSDATEIFVFISGYSAALAYSRKLEKTGFRACALACGQRSLTLYAAQMFMTAGLLALVNLFFSGTANWNHYLAEVGLDAWVGMDETAGLLELYSLGIRPVNMDILPLYMAFLTGLPVVLLGMTRYPGATLAVSAFIACAVWQSVPMVNRVPGSSWVFNPWAWQFLFVLGVACATQPRLLALCTRASPGISAFAVTYLVFGGIVVLSWHVDAIANLLPEVLTQLIYPISKQNADMLRLLHFLSLAWLTTRILTRESPLLVARGAQPFIRCGQAALSVFCFGVLFSFIGNVLLREVRSDVLAQLVIVVAGCFGLIAIAGMHLRLMVRLRGHAERRRVVGRSLA